MSDALIEKLAALQLYDDIEQFDGPTG